MKNFLEELKILFERVDRGRDNILFLFIKPYWPRNFTPNHLTIIRIIFSLFLFVLLFYYKNTDKTLILSLFFIGALTDILDGSVARGLDKVTKVGEMLDPLADRMLIIPIAIYSLAAQHYWLLVILLGLEIINALVSAYGYMQKVFVASNIFGKIKMVLHSVVFMAILIVWPQSPSIFFIYLLWISNYFIIISIFFKILEVRTKSHEQKHQNI